MIHNWVKFLESVGEIHISDIESYIGALELGQSDKLFFLDKIDPDIIVDFGCANGLILSKIKKSKPNVKLIGYDIDEGMLSIARPKLGAGSILTDKWNDVKEEIGRYENPAIILSSVIHEVYSYSKSSDIKYFWENQVFGGDFKYVCIRDMVPSTKMSKHSDFTDDVNKVREKSDPFYLESFEERWGGIGSDYRTFIHFLLKYTYTDNWNREVNENYVPLTLETLYKKIPNEYKITYQDNFILPSLLEQVKKDFDINIDHTTHTKMIIERK